jgi:Domain of unknown function (DUF4111)/Nucleotidyltransferase domain
VAPVTTVEAGVARACAAYLEQADRLAPGLVQGLYLQGSVALDDYRPGVSDIDFVAVTASPPGPDVVRSIHAGLPRRKPYFDGLYVGWDDLQRDPAQVAAGPAVHEWRVQPESRFERHLVTWHVLAQGGVAVRGPAVADLKIFTDWPALADSTRRNLDEYWRPLLRRMSASPVGLSAWVTTWNVLGVARLLHTLDVGRVTSKTEAAAFARQRYGERWERVIGEALRIRVGGPRSYRNPFRRRADMIGFMTEALSGPSQVWSRGRAG